jgi:hypothetical protein
LGNGWLGGVAGAVPDGAGPAGVVDEGACAVDGWACADEPLVDAVLLPPHPVSATTPASSALVSVTLCLNEFLLICGLLLLSSGNRPATEPAVMPPRRW